jgi:hypothetical protein
MQFCLSLRDTTDEHCVLSIHSSTLEEAIICLDYLVGLEDTHFEVLMLSRIGEHDAPHLCPFGAGILEKMLQNSARRIIFSHVIFTPDHCRTLATSGTKTNIGFILCEF